jgi:hypothetical protein
MLRAHDLKLSDDVAVKKVRKDNFFASNKLHVNYLSLWVAAK